MQLAQEGATALADRHGSRGPGRQAPKRLLERLVREGAVQLTARLRHDGCPANCIAGLLSLAGRTLRHWVCTLRRLPLALQLFGRPAKRAPLGVRRDLLDVLGEVGPGVSVAWLRDHFPEMGKRELEDYLCRYRRVWRRQQRASVPVLRWTVPGSVWAMDFTELPHAVDARYPYLLAVRDLASGKQLLALPTEHMTEETVRPALAALFAEHGSPFVLKTDNGSAFKDRQARDYLHHHGVTCLYSPARRPGYNGAIEAGIGSLKTRIARQAMLQGRPDVWTMDDIAAAVHEANTMARPHGSNGPNPDQAWHARPELGSTQRLDFLAALADEQRAARALRHDVALEDLTNDALEPMWSQRHQHSVDRLVVRRTLEACGYLCYPRRRFVLPIISKLTARDS